MGGRSQRHASWIDLQRFTCGLIFPKPSVLYLTTAPATREVSFKLGRVDILISNSVLGIELYVLACAYIIPDHIASSRAAASYTTAEDATTTSQVTQPDGLSRVSTTRLLPSYKRRRAPSHGTPILVEEYELLGAIPDTANSSRRVRVFLNLIPPNRTPRSTES